MKRQGITLGVTQPRKESGCWAQVYVYAGDAWSPLAVCGNPARKGFLTCLKHQDRQAAAQELQALAGEAGIPYETIKPSLLPSGRVPSLRNRERLESWLAAKGSVAQPRAEGTHGRSADRMPAPAGSHAAALDRAASSSAAAPSPRVASGADGNGSKRSPHEAGAFEPGALAPQALPVHQLTIDQREQLAAWRAVAWHGLDNRAIRDAIGVTPDVVEQAVVGDYLGAAVITRLTEFLARQPAGGSAAAS